jgi:hypothetical protein
VYCLNCLFTFVDPHIAALWLFIPPTTTALKAIIKFLEESGGKDKARRQKVANALKVHFPEVRGATRTPSVRGTMMTPPLLLSVFNDIQSFIEKNPKSELAMSGVLVVEQMSGYVIEIKPGQMHAVCNATNTVKFAYDRVVLEDLPQIAVVQSLIASGILPHLMPEDYTAVSHSAMDLANMLSVGE